MGTSVHSAEQALAKGHPGADVIILLGLDHAVAAGVDSAGERRQPVGLDRLGFLPGRVGLGLGRTCGGAAHRFQGGPVAGQRRPDRRWSALEVRRRRLAGQLGEPGLGIAELAPEQSEPALRGGDERIDLGNVARGRDALGDPLLDRGSKLLLVGDEGLGQRDQGAIGENVVPGRDRSKRGPVGGAFGLGRGRAQPADRRKLAKAAGAPVEKGLGGGEQDVGALRRARPLDDIVLVLREFA
jgi:hypothetical protein